MSQRARTTLERAHRHRGVACGHRRGPARHRGVAAGRAYESTGTGGVARAAAGAQPPGLAADGASFERASASGQANNEEERAAVILRKKGEKKKKTRVI